MVEESNIRYLQRIEDARARREQAAAERAYQDIHDETLLSYVPKKAET